MERSLKQGLTSISMAISAFDMCCVPFVIRRSPFVITTNLFGAAHLSGLREREQRGQAVQCTGAIEVAPLARVASTVDDVKQAGQ